MVDDEVSSFEDIVQELEPERDLSGFRKLPDGCRRSIKYNISCPSVWSGFVFAPDPFAAVNIARERYDIPVEEDIKVERAFEGGMNTARHSGLRDAIHPDM